MERWVRAVARWPSEQAHIRLKAGKEASGTGQGLSLRAELQ